MAFDRIMNMENLFAYGTLMCDDIMQEVSGLRVRSVPGTLKGYSRRSVKSQKYPGVLPDESGSVEGVVYLNVLNLAWDRLDRFEGEMYARQIVEVEVNDGARLRAETYVVKPNFLDHLDQTDWDFADFLRNGKASFQRHYKGYRAF